MFRNSSAKITDKLIGLNTINSEDREIYEFGIQHIFITLLNISTVILIGFLIKSVKEAIVFISAFIPLRIFAGGFHFSTPFRCYIFSSCFVAGVLLAMRYFSVPLLIYCLLYCISGIIILSFSPVEDRNKPLDRLEKKVYRKRTIIIFGLENIAILILYFAKLHFAVQSIMVSTIILSLMIAFGFIKNSIINSKQI